MTEISRPSKKKSALFDLPAANPSILMVRIGNGSVPAMHRPYVPGTMENSTSSGPPTRRSLSFKAGNVWFIFTLYQTVTRLL